MIFKTLNDGRYFGADAEHGIEFHVDRVRMDNRQELVGDLTIAAGMLSGKAEGPLTTGSFNFSFPRTRFEWATRCARLARTGNKVPFERLLEQLCTLVQQAERNGGGPAVHLRDVARPQYEQELSVLGLTFPRAHPTIIFGDGGTTKSLLALRVASELAEQGLKIGYFDWELDAHVHRDRLERINGPNMPDLIYIKCDKPLVQDVDRLKRIVRHEEITFGFLDSVGYGTLGEPEKAEAALGYCRAFRQLGIGGWLIAHVTKAENGDQRPFGSTFWHNSARCTWNIKLAATSPDGERLSLGAFNRKSNLGRTRPAQGITVQFNGDRGIEFTRTDAAQIDELADSLPLWQRMRESLRHGPCSIADLSEEFAAKPEAIKKAAQRGRNVFTKLDGGFGVPPRLALVERRAQ